MITEFSLAGFSTRTLLPPDTCWLASLWLRAAAASGHDDPYPAGPSAIHPPEPITDQLRLAVAAYLARFKGSSREHTESDLRCYLSRCAEHGLDPPAVQRPHLELVIRWMQQIRRFKPSAVSRRFSVTAGFYQTCSLDGIIEHSPAEHVRRPSVPAELPTLAFTHLQFEALLTAGAGRFPGVLLSR